MSYSGEIELSVAIRAEKLMQELTNIISQAQNTANKKNVEINTVLSDKGIKEINSKLRELKSNEINAFFNDAKISSEVNKIIKDLSTLENKLASLKGKQANAPTIDVKKVEQAYSEIEKAYAKYQNSLQNNVGIKTTQNNFTNSLKEYFKVGGEVGNINKEIINSFKELQAKIPELKNIIPKVDTKNTTGQIKELEKQINELNAKLFEKISPVVSNNLNKITKDVELKPKIDSTRFKAQAEVELSKIEIQKDVKLNPVVDKNQIRNVLDGSTIDTKVNAVVTNGTGISTTNNTENSIKNITEDTQKAIKAQQKLQEETKKTKTAITETAQYKDAEAFFFSNGDTSSSKQEQKSKSKETKTSTKGNKTSSTNFSGVSVDSMAKEMEMLNQILSTIKLIETEYAVHKVTAVSKSAEGSSKALTTEMNRLETLRSKIEEIKIKYDEMLLSSGKTNTDISSTSSKSKDTATYNTNIDEQYQQKINSIKEIINQLPQAIQNGLVKPFDSATDGVIIDIEVIEKYVAELGQKISSLSNNKIDLKINNIDEIKKKIQEISESYKNAMSISNQSKNNTIMKYDKNSDAGIQYFTKVFNDMEKMRSSVVSRFKKNGFSNINVDGITDATGKLEKLIVTAKNANDELQKFEYARQKGQKGGKAQAYMILQESDIQKQLQALNQLEAKINEINNKTIQLKITNLDITKLDEQIAILKENLSTIESEKKIKMTLSDTKDIIDRVNNVIKILNQIPKEKSVNIKVTDNGKGLNVIRKTNEEINKILNSIPKEKEIKVSAVAKGIDDTISKLRTLNEELQKLPSKKESKIDIVASNISDIIKQLDNLPKSYNNLKKSINGKSIDLSINLGKSSIPDSLIDSFSKLKSAVDGLDISLLKETVNSLNKMNFKIQDSSIQSLAKLPIIIKELKTEMNGFDASIMQGFISSIDGVLSKSKELKELSKVLEQNKNSIKNIENYTSNAKNKDEKNKETETLNKINEQYKMLKQNLTAMKKATKEYWSNNTSNEEREILLENINAYEQKNNKIRETVKSLGQFKDEQKNVIEILEREISVINNGGLNKYNSDLLRAIQEQETMLESIQRTSRAQETNVPKGTEKWAEALSLLEKYKSELGEIAKIQYSDNGNKQVYTFTDTNNKSIKVNTDGDRVSNIETLLNENQLLKEQESIQNRLYALRMKQVNGDTSIQTQTKIDQLLREQQVIQEQINNARANGIIQAEREASILELQNAQERDLLNAYSQKAQVAYDKFFNANSNKTGFSSVNAEAEKLKNTISQITDTEGLKNFKAQLSELETKFRNINKLGTGTLISSSVDSNNAKNIFAQYASRIGQITDAITVRQGSNGITTFTTQVINAEGEVEKLRAKFSEASHSIVVDSTNMGKALTGFSLVMDTLRKKAAQLITYYTAMYLNPYMLVGRIKEVINSVVDLDTALVDLKKTAKMSGGELNDFYLNANESAKKLGVTTEQIIQQAADWSRSGYQTSSEATRMAELSSQFAAISPDVDTSQSTTGLLSVMKAFKIETDDVLDGIMSKINACGNAFSETNGNIITGLEKSSAAMSAANNSLDETIALFTAGQEITQNAETVGQSLKTISMRIRGKRTLPPYTVMYMLCDY